MSSGLDVGRGELARAVDGARDHIRGSPDAPVTLVEYGDYQCPSCGRAHTVVKRILEEFPGRVRLVFRHFPIDRSHPRARAAAMAAEAAAAQGMFWEMHDRLFESQESLEDSDLLRHAEQLGLDAGRFQRDLEERVYAERVQEDVDSAERSGVTGTPTFFIDGVRYEGSRDFDSLKRALEAAEGDGGMIAVDRSSRAGRPSADLEGSVPAWMKRSEGGAPAVGRAVRDIFSTDEIFERVVATADEEFSRSNRLLFFSGIAAGLSLSLSFLGIAALTAAVPGEGAQLVGSLLYPVGFILVLLGRYQLYTENTLTPVTLVLTRIASLPALFNLWGVVLAANLIGAAAAAYLFARTGIFDPDTAEVARTFAQHSLDIAWWDLFWKGLIAGWLVATIVWLNHAARDTVSRIFIVFSIIYLLAVTDLAHCVVGACEILYLVFEGGATFGAFAWDFFTPVTLGNTVGGVFLVAILNFSQTRNERFRDRDCSALELPWRDWCLAMRTGAPDGDRDDRRKRS